MSGSLPVDEAGIDNFIAAFEAGTLPKEQWTHAAHLLTGACYVYDFGEARAIDLMRRNVSAYNLAVGGQNTETSGYHETITVFWIKLLAGLLRERQPIRRVEFAKCAVDHFLSQRDILRRFYDFDVAASAEGRRTWLPPTLERLD